MKITMLQTRLIARYGLRSVGDTWDAPETLAKQLIRQGFAVEVSYVDIKADEIKIIEPNIEPEEGPLLPFDGEGKDTSQK